MNNHEWLCVCQSKKGRTGLCDILPEYQKELAIYKKALEIAVAQIDELCAVSTLDCDKCPLHGKCKLCFFRDTTIEQFLEEAQKENHNG